MSKIMLADLHEHGVSSHIVAVRSSTLMPHEIRSLAVMTANHPPSLREKEFAASEQGSEYALLAATPVYGADQKPMHIRDQLSHPLTGSTSFREKCQSCKSANQNCYGGHSLAHEFSHPVCHTGFLDQVCTLSGFVCFFCSRFVRGDVLDKLETILPAEVEENELLYAQWRALQRERFVAVAPKLTHHASTASTNAAAATAANSDGSSSSSTSASASSLEICHSCGMPQPLYTVNEEVLSIRWNLLHSKVGQQYGWEPDEELLVLLWTRMVNSWNERKRGPLPISDESSYPQHLRFEEVNEDAQCDTTDTAPTAEKENDGHLLKVYKDIDFNIMVDHFISTHHIPFGSETEEERWVMRSLPLIMHKYREKFLSIPFTCAEAYMIFECMRHEDIYRYGLDPRYDHPKSLITRNMLILSKVLHPDVAEWSGSSSARSDPLTLKYASLMKTSRNVRFHTIRVLANSIHENGGKDGIFGHSSLNLNRAYLWRLYGLRRLFWSDNGIDELNMAIATAQFDYACFMDHTVAERKNSSKNHNSGKTGSKNALSEKQNNDDTSPANANGGSKIPLSKSSSSTSAPTRSKGGATKRSNSSPTPSKKNGKTLNSDNSKGTPKSKRPAAEKGSSKSSQQREQSSESENTADETSANNAKKTKKRKRFFITTTAQGENNDEPVNSNDDEEFVAGEEDDEDDMSAENTAEAPYGYTKAGNPRKRPLKRQQQQQQSSRDSKLATESNSSHNSTLSDSNETSSAPRSNLSVEPPLSETVKQNEVLPQQQQQGHVIGLFKKRRAYNNTTSSTSSSNFNSMLANVFGKWSLNSRNADNHPSYLSFNVRASHPDDIQSVELLDNNQNGRSLGELLTPSFSLSSSSFNNRSFPVKLYTSSPALPNCSLGKYGANPISSNATNNFGGKTGPVRSNMLGKRASQIIRKALTHDGTLGYDEIGISENACLILTVPIVVNRYNIDRLKERVKRGAGVLDGAYLIETDESAIIHLPVKNVKMDTDIRQNAHACIGQVESHTLFNSNNQIGDLYEQKKNNTAGGSSSSASSLSSSFDFNDPPLKIGWVVRVYLDEGCLVIFNRQPTLQRGSHGMHWVKTRRGHIIGLNANTATAYNGDFDGDTANASAPQEAQMKAEAMCLMSIAQNVMCPRTHRPLIAPNQDHMTASFIMTSKDTFLNRNHAMRIVGMISKISPKRLSQMNYLGFESTFLQKNPSLEMDQDDDSNHKEEEDQESDVQLFESQRFGSKISRTRFVLPPPAILKPEQLWTGKQLFELVMPRDLCYVVDNSSGSNDRWNVPVSTSIKSDEKFWNSVVDESNNIIYISRGKWLCGSGSGDVFGKKQSSIIKHLWIYYGAQFVTDWLSDCEQMCHEFLSIRGFTCSIADMMLGGIANSEVLSLWQTQQELAMNDQLKSQLISNRMSEISNGKIESSISSILPAMTAVEGNVGSSSSSSDIGDPTTTTKLSFHQQLLKFRRYAEEQRYVAFDVLEKSFAQVMEYLRRPDVMRHLKFSDLKSIQMQMQKWCAGMITFCNDMMVSFTNKRQNNIMIMLTSTAKGSIMTAMIMATMTGLESLDGSPVGVNKIGPESRGLSHARMGEFTPNLLGLTKTGFVTGLSENDYWLHNEAARSGIIESTKLSDYGYTLRTLAGNIASCSIHYDGTLRNDPENITQLCSGGDGYGSKKIHSIKITHHQLSPSQASLFNACKYCNTNSEHHHHQSESHLPLRIVNIAHLKNWISQSASSKWSSWFDSCCSGITRCESCNKEHSYHSDLTNTVLGNREFRVQHDMKSAEQLRKSGFTLMLNINASEILRTHSTKWLEEFFALTMTGFTDLCIDVACKILTIDTQFTTTQREDLDQIYSFIKTCFDRYNHLELVPSITSTETPTTNDELVLEFWNNILMNQSLESLFPISHGNYWTVLQNLLNEIDAYGPQSCITHEARLAIVSFFRFCWWRSSSTVTAESCTQTSFGLSLHLATPKQIQQLFQDLYETYCEGFAEPGTAIGNESIQAVTSGYSQITLNAFKVVSGAGASLVTDGDGDISRFVNLSSGQARTKSLLKDGGKKLATSVTCTLSPNWARNEWQARVVASQLVERFLEQICFSHPHIHWMDTKSSLLSQKRFFSSASQQQQHSSSKSAQKISSHGQITPFHCLYSTLRTMFTSTYLQLENDTASNNDINIPSSYSKEPSSIFNLRANSSYSSTPPRQSFVLFRLRDEYTHLEESNYLQKSLDNVAGLSGSFRQTLETRLNSCLLPWQRGMIIGGPTVKSKCPYYWCLWFILNKHDDTLFSVEDMTAPMTSDGKGTRKSTQASPAPPMMTQPWLRHLDSLKEMSCILLSKWRVSGVNGVEDCLAIQPTKNDISTTNFESDGGNEITPQDCWTLHLKSKNFKAVLVHPAVMDQFTRTTNWTAIEDLFGQDLGIQQWSYETSVAIKSAGDVNIQNRHVLTIGCNMMHTGNVTVMSRFGAEKRPTTAFFQKIGFEEANRNITESALNTGYDVLSHTTANIMLGKKPPFIGTGCAEITAPRSVVDSSPTVVNTSINYNLVDGINEEEDALSYLKNIVPQM